MIEEYRTEYFAEVKAFAGRLDNFSYVERIISNKFERRVPGGCWVWREDGRIAAFCGLAWLNRDDAWLYGMRVDKNSKGRGIATRFTRALFTIARKAGKTWAGLNTLDHSGPAPVFRVAEKLGMKLEAIHATDHFWELPGRFRHPRPARLRGIFRHYTGNGEKLSFNEGPGWIWTRLLPARERSFNANGYRLLGTPLHIVDHCETRTRRGHHQYTVNLYDRPENFEAFLSGLLGYAAGKKRGLTVNYPAAWQKEFRGAARKLLRGKKGFVSVWRVYGKRL